MQNHHVGCQKLEEVKVRHGDILEEGWKKKEREKARCSGKLHEPSFYRHCQHLGSEKLGTWAVSTLILGSHRLGGGP